MQILKRNNSLNQINHYTFVDGYILCAFDSHDTALKSLQFYIFAVEFIDWITASREKCNQPRAVRQLTHFKLRVIFIFLIILSTLHLRLPGRIFQFFSLERLINEMTYLIEVEIMN